jgi:signal transduction histidine kinase
MSYEVISPIEPTDRRKRFGKYLFYFITVCIVALGITYFSLSFHKPYMGVSLNYENQTWEVSMVDRNGLGDRAGITIGDKPVEINGQPAAVFLEKYIKDGSVSTIVIKDLTVTNKEGLTKTASLEISSPSQQTVTEFITLSIVAFLFWIIGVFVFVKKPWDIPARIFLLSGLFIGLTIITNLAAERHMPSAYAITAVLFAVSPWVLAHFFLVLPEERTKYRKSLKAYLLYVPALVMLVLFPLIGYVNGQPTPLFKIVRLFEMGAGFIATIYIAFYNYFRSSSVKTRQQMKIVAISYAAALIPILVFFILPSMISHTQTPMGFIVFFLVLIPVGMGYAILTQGLMDIRVIIRRSVIYALVTLVMAIILSIAIFTALKLQNTLGVIEEIFLAIGLGAIATFLFGPIKNGIELIIDKFFYKDRYDYRQIIEILSNSLKSLNDVSDISRVVVGTVTQTLNLNGTCLLMNVEDYYEVGTAQGTFTDTGYQNRLKTLASQAEQNLLFPNDASSLDPNLAYLVPLTFEDQKIGVLCLSKKASMQQYSYNDIFLIQGIASIATIALHSALLVRDVSAKNTFISIASHELRTPLTAITGYAELLLRKEPEDATKKKWLKTILHNGQQIIAMANELLNVSRIQSGKIVLKMKPVNLPYFLHEQISMIQENTEKHKIVFDADPDLPEVLLDNDKFTQVINNLLNNAIKYSPDGGRVTVSAYRHATDNSVLISVGDEGIGISPEDVKSLFTTFHRIQRPETQRIRGSGLGLYIAKEWTEAMGGKIWVESEINKGSTFYVAFPLNNLKAAG